MKISTRSRYGLRLLMELAGNADGKPVFLKEIAKNQRISGKYLSRLVLSLRSAGLVRSVRGAHGGYVLACPPDSIRLREIIDALEGGQYIIRCADNPACCPASRTCAAREVWVGLENVMRDYCESISLGEIVRRGKKRLPPGWIRPVRTLGKREPRESAP